MTNIITVNAFYIYQILWVVFVTFVAFLAAIVFWKKGPSTTEGRLPAFPVSWKFTGAGAIFVVVLLIFFLLIPLKGIPDYKKILIVYATQDFPSLPDSPRLQYKIMQSQINAVGLDLNKLSVRLTPVQFIYDLSPELAGDSFVTKSTIPKGKYFIRFAFSETGDSKEYLLDVN